MYPKESDKIKSVMYNDLIEDMKEISEYFSMCGIVELHRTKDTFKCSKEQLVKNNIKAENERQQQPYFNPMETMWEVEVEELYAKILPNQLRH